MPEQLTTLANLNLKGCPIGSVFETTDPDTSVEDKFFGDWGCPLANPRRKMSGRMRVMLENGVEVLDHVDTSDRCLVTGTTFWRDYAVEASVRQIVGFAGPNMDELRCTVGRTGLMCRYQDLRHYYFFCIEGLDRLVFYRREDDTWAALDEEPIAFDRGRYYTLRVECDGNQFTCSVDGQQAFVVNDDQFSTGKCGLRTNTRSRVKSATVTATEAQHSAAVQTREKSERELGELREKYPQPVLCKKIDISRFGTSALRFGNLRGDGPQMLLCMAGQEPEEDDRVVALDLAGETLWETSYPKDATGRWAVFADIDRDGADEIIYIREDRIRVLKGRTGELAAETEIPPAGPFLGRRNSKAIPHKIVPLYACNLRGKSAPMDILFRDGDGGGSGFNLWAYDEKLNLRWTQTVDDPWYGMYMWFYDVDGDGRDEVLPGYHLYDGDGKLLWRMEGADYVERYGEHVDHASFGELDGDPSNGPEVAVAGSSEGYYLLEARTGKVRRRHRVGHAQGIYAGNFRPDLPGLEQWVGNRWGNYGTLTLYSGDGRKLHSFEPDNISQGGPAVNWTGDGEELLFLYSSPEALGMYDGYGRKVVAFPEGETPDDTWVSAPTVMSLTGDARDEIIFKDEGAVYIFTQDGPSSGEEKVYAPVRTRDISHPNWETQGPKPR